MQSPKSLPPIKLKNSAKLIIGKNHIIGLIVEHYKSIPQYLELKNDVEVIEQITQLVFDLMSKHSTSDPKTIIIQILVQLFAINETESFHAERIIDYMIANKITAKTKKSVKSFQYVLKQLKKLVPS